METSLLPALLQRMLLLRATKMNQHELLHAALSVPPVSAASASVFGLMPSELAAVVASVFSVLWIVVQAYFFFKDRKGKK